MIDKKVEQIVMDSLTEFLGVTHSDVTKEDSISDDLHMSPTDLTDLMEIIKSKGLDTSDIDLGNIDTVGELIDELTLETDL